MVVRKIKRKVRKVVRKIKKRISRPKPKVTVRRIPARRLPPKPPRRVPTKKPPKKRGGVSVTVRKKQPTVVRRTPSRSSSRPRTRTIIQKVFVPVPQPVVEEPLNTAPLPPNQPTGRPARTIGRQIGSFRGLTLAERRAERAGRRRTPLGKFRGRIRDEF